MRQWAYDTRTLLMSAPTSASSKLAADWMIRPISTESKMLRQAPKMSRFVVTLATDALRPSQSVFVLYVSSFVAPM